MHRTRHRRGFTLIEVMITVAIVAILAGIAMPAYTAYIQRSRVPPALDALSALATRMEQRFQDAGAYTCPADLAAAGEFGIACEVSPDSQGFTATATGSGSVSGYGYSINDQGVRITTAHPKGVPTQNCWSMKGAVCDS
jgi:type IV pilus assembly protein PilE